MEWYFRPGLAPGRLLGQGWTAACGVLLSKLFNLRNAAINSSCLFAMVWSSMGVGGSSIVD